MLPIARRAAQSIGGGSFDRPNGGKALTAPPVLPNERIAHLGRAAECCAAQFQSGLCLVGVMNGPTATVRVESARLPTSDIRMARLARPFRAITGCEQSQQTAWLFDHLIGAL